MASPDNRIYKTHSTWRTILGIVIALVIVAVIGLIAIFLGFKKYIVYTSDGVRLEVPWLEESAEGSPE